MAPAADFAEWAKETVRDLLSETDAFLVGRGDAPTKHRLRAQPKHSAKAQRFQPYPSAPVQEPCQRPYQTPAKEPLPQPLPGPGGLFPPSPYVPPLGSLPQLLPLLPAQQAHQIYAQALQSQGLHTQALQTHAQQNQTLQAHALLNQTLQNQSLLNQSLQNQSLLNQSLQNQSLQNQSLQATVFPAQQANQIYAQSLQNQALQSQLLGALLPGALLPGLQGALGGQAGLWGPFAGLGGLGPLSAGVGGQGGPPKCASCACHVGTAAQPPQPPRASAFPSTREEYSAMLEQQRAGMREAGGGGGKAAAWDVRGLLEELCPEDDGGQPTAETSASASQASPMPSADALPSAQPSQHTAKAPAAPWSSGKERPERPAMELDLDSKAQLSGLAPWRAAKEARAVDVENLESELKLFRDLRRRKERLDEKRLRDRMRLQGIAIPDMELSEEEEEEEEEPSLPELPDDAENRISKALDAPESVVLATLESQPITSKDLRTLKGLNWLNDEVINFYMTLIVERSKEEGRPKVHAFNTFFLPRLMEQGYGSVRRWTRRVDVFAKDLLLVPVHLGVHWCMAVVDLAAREVHYFDSMGAPNDAALEALRDYVAQEHQDKKKAPLDVADWALLNRRDIPQQQNGSDCGMFACKFADYAAARKKITFTQQHIPYFRRRMIYEIVTKTLLP